LETVVLLVLVVVLEAQVVTLFFLLSLHLAEGAAENLAVQLHTMVEMVDLVAEEEKTLAILVLVVKEIMELIRQAKDIMAEMLAPILVTMLAVVVVEQEPPVKKAHQPMVV
jgi:hypothetical protein